MKRAFLGDSYDAVKRMWRELLHDWAPLYAEPMFIADNVRQDFTLLTKIPILTDDRPETYSILNDPDTGIRLPGGQDQSEGQGHITVKRIISQLRIKGVRCVITFDQSHYRNHEQTREQQHRAKMRPLVEAGFGCFYYVSHAPFLFATPDVEARDEVLEILRGSAISNDHRPDRLFLP